MKSTRDTVEHELRTLLTERFAVPAEQITPEAHLFDDLGLDSVDLISAVAILEERHSLTITDENLQDMLVVRGLVDRVTQLLERS
ncbi:acyl carrier protein [Streptomyces orinoci]|uniref:Acyl carrier protein n=1 Tax=Streptomyces orinoci TaxID=67339 RepID=A0ABV3JQS2_STRON|nr:acyl carrier protein [Streptomyces orinoci]